MRKLLILFLILSFNARAGTVTQATVYSTGSTVTAANLNANFGVAINEMNGGLDNENADTSNGFRFSEVKGALPAAGTQGRTIFLTTDNTLYFDTGSVWNPVVTVSGAPSQGEVIYYNGSAWVRLAASTANYVFVTNGAGNNPAFEQIDLTSPPAIGGTTPATGAFTTLTATTLGGAKNVRGILEEAVETNDK